MDYNTIFVGMDIHKENFLFATILLRKMSSPIPVQITADYKHILDYIASLCGISCGYEAGCLGFTLYHQLTEHDVNCFILAPTTMPIVKEKNQNE